MLLVRRVHHNDAYSRHDGRRYVKVLTRLVPTGRANGSLVEYGGVIEICRSNCWPANLEQPEHLA